MGYLTNKLMHQNDILTDAVMQDINLICQMRLISQMMHSRSTICNKCVIDLYRIRHSAFKEPFGKRQYHSNTKINLYKGLQF